MPATAEGFYADTIRALPPTERLRLAALILEDLAQPHWSVVDTRDTWSEEDLRGQSPGSRPRSFWRR